MRPPSLASRDGGEPGRERNDAHHDVKQQRQERDSGRSRKCQTIVHCRTSEESHGNCPMGIPYDCTNPVFHGARTNPVRQPVIPEGSRRIAA